jgi:hypothetical protein
MGARARNSVIAGRERIHPKILQQHEEDDLSPRGVEGFLRIQMIDASLINPLIGDQNTHNGGIYSEDVQLSGRYADRT